MNKITNKILFGICIFLWFWLPAAGQQNYHFKHFTSEDGLSYSSVTCILRDSYGFLWIGTDNGLNRYDGYSFCVYRNERLNINSLPDNACSSLYEDSRKNLWLVSRKGVSLYNRMLNRFEQCAFDIKKDNEFDDFVVFSIVEDHHNNMLVGTIGGLFVFDKVSNKFKAKTVKNDITKTLSSKKISSLVADNFGSIWIGVDDNEFGGVFKVYNDSVTGTYRQGQSTSSISSNYIVSLFVDKTNNLWIGTRGFGIDRISANGGSIKHFSGQTNKLLSEGMELNQSISQAPNGSIWAASVKGIIIIDTCNFNIKKIVSNSIDPTGLLSNIIYAIAFDKQGTVYIGSKFGGVDYYNKQFDNFQNYAFTRKPTSLSCNNTTTIAEDNDGYTWIATDGGGINRFDPKKKTFKHFSTQTHLKGLTNDKVISLLVDNDNNMWIGMWVGGISKYHIEKGQLTFLKHYSYLDSKDMNSHSSFSIYQTKSGQIWVGAWNSGLFYYDNKSDGFVHVDIFSKSSHTPVYVDYLFEDNKDNLWVCTENLGIFKRNFKSGKISHYYYNEKRKNAISSAGVFCGMQDSKGRVWIGTSTGGLNLYNEDQDSFIQFSKEINLIGSSVVGIQEDKKGNIWISTNKGIIKMTTVENLSTTKLIWRNFNKTDGLQGEQFNRCSSFKSRSGFIYMGGINGLTIFHPDSLCYNDATIPVYIYGINFNNPQLSKELDSTINKAIFNDKKVIIPFNCNSFTLTFSGINLIFPEKNKYRCILIGVNTDWVNLGTKREATYSNLPAGRYRFIVQACNNDGVWNYRGDYIDITIEIPYWKSWWFILLCVVILLGFVFSILQLRTRFYRNREKELNSLVNERTKELVETNNTLLEQQSKIEEQQEELNVYTQYLKDTNEELLVNQDVIKDQTQKLSEANIQLIKVNTQLSAINSTKDKLFSILAHDLKSPFNAILGFSELLYENIEEYSIEKTKRHISTIRDAAKHTYNLLDNLLQWSRAQRGVIDFEPKPIDMKAFIDMQLDMLRVQATAKEVIIVSKVIGKPIFVMADENMLSAIVRNLTSNAIKYSNSGEMVQIELNYSSVEFVFSIKDSGIGMDEEYRETIFSVTNLESHIGTAGEKGTGLGLLLCADFVARHGGRIWVESEKDKGSTFYFTLPYA